jgi:type IX secretion system PorP/SprF family membrane protein
MKKRAYIFILLFLPIPVVVKAQSDFDLSQRFFNEAVYNPAATGNTFSTSFYSQLRKQWAGLDGAPTTEVLGVDTYLKSFRSAIGLSLTGDQIGITNTYTIRASYAFYIPLGDLMSLSLGVAGGVINRNKNANGALVDDLNDGELYFGNLSATTPDFDFGFEFQGFMKFGVSVRHLGATFSRNSFPDNSKNIWSYISTRFNVLYNLSFEPMASYMRRDDINRYEIGGIFYMLKSDDMRFYNDKYWIGGVWRFNEQFSVLAGMHITPQLRIGYSFDYGFRDLSLISKGGTHEIFLAWNFNRQFYKDKYKCSTYKDPEYDSTKESDRMEKLHHRWY